MSRYTALSDMEPLDLGYHGSAYDALDFYLSACYPGRLPVTGSSPRGGGTLQVHVIERGQAEGFDVRIVADSREVA